jgi:hypothetical protein
MQSSSGSGSKVNRDLVFASRRRICRNTGTGEVIVMQEMDDKLRLGVVLVEDIASQVADSEICQFFSHIENVTAVSVIQADNGFSGRRFCWVSVKNPFETVAKLKGMEIAGRRLHMRLMGYLYPAQQDG